MHLNPEGFDALFGSNFYSIVAFVQEGFPIVVDPHHREPSLDTVKAILFYRLAEPVILRFAGRWPFLVHPFKGAQLINRNFHTSDKLSCAPTEHPGCNSSVLALLISLIPLLFGNPLLALFPFAAGVVIKNIWLIDSGFLTDASGGNAGLLLGGGQHIRRLTGRRGGRSLAIHGQLSIARALHRAAWNNLFTQLDQLAKTVGFLVGEAEHLSNGAHECREAVHLLHLDLLQQVLHAPVSQAISQQLMHVLEAVGFLQQRDGVFGVLRSLNGAIHHALVILLCFSLKVDKFSNGLPNPAVLINAALLVLSDQAGRYRMDKLMRGSRLVGTALRPGIIDISQENVTTAVPNPGPASCHLTEG